MHDKIGTGRSAIKIPHKIKKDPNNLPTLDCGIKSPYPIVVKEIIAHQNECGIPKKSKFKNYILFSRIILLIKGEFSPSASNSMK